MKCIILLFEQLLDVLENLLAYNSSDNSYKNNRDFVIKRRY